jgi:N6-adenosine-specific RNA methylase IME4
MAKKITTQTGRSSALKHPPGKLFGYRRHAAGATWPLIEGDEFDDLVESVKARGLDDDVILVDDLVLDGWNRLRACQAAGVKPRFRHYKGAKDIDSLLEYVDTKNARRRHLSKSVRAAIAAEAERLRQGNSAERKEGTAKSQAERAKKAGVSERLVRRAELVHDKATPKLWDAVKRDRIAVDAAVEVVKLPAERQDELAQRAIDEGKEMKPGKVRALARQEAKREVVQRINSELVAPMPIGPFSLIVVDYPWKYENSDQHEGSRGHLPYPPMSMLEITDHAREATKRAADDCVLGLWVTNAHLLEVKGVLEAWGFTYQVPITWNKVHVGMGIAGPRGQTEHLIIAYKGEPQHTLNELTTLITAPREPGHSKKPDRFYDELAKHVAGRRLELFAVGPEREGWECWGAEAGKPNPTSRKSKILTESDARAVGAAP